MGRQGEAQILGGKKRAPEGSLFKDVLMILGAFLGPKMMKNHVFLEPLLKKKKHDFLKIVLSLQRDARF